jgi:hypothetical protein
MEKKETYSVLGGPEVDYTSGGENLEAMRNTAYVCL